MIKLFLTLAVGTLCGLLCRKKDIPAGMMIGSMMGAMLFSVLTGLAWVPVEFRFLAQAVSGAAIGFGFGREDAKKLPGMIKPLSLLMLALIVVNLVVGLLIYFFSPLDIITSLLCCLPGGLSETPPIAEEMGGNMAQVAFLQFIRMSVGIGLLPAILGHMFKDDLKSVPQPAPSAASKSANSASAEQPLTLPLILLMIIATIGGGFLGNWVGIPAGTIIGSMLLTMALKLALPRIHFSVKIKRAAQVLAGSYVGSSVTAQDLRSLPYLIVPVVLIIVGYTIYWLILGRAMHNLYGIERKAAYLSVIPAGGGDIALMAADLGIYDTDLLVMQIFRMILVIGIFPQVIRLIAAFFI